MTDGKTKYLLKAFSVIQCFEIIFFRQKYQYEINFINFNDWVPLVRRGLQALVYISRTSINILGAVTSLHIFLTKPVKGITIFLFVPKDSYVSLLTPWTDYRRLMTSSVDTKDIPIYLTSCLMSHIPIHKLFTCLSPSPKYVRISTTSWTNLSSALRYNPF
jgi:hypothetical protein